MGISLHGLMEGFASKLAKTAAKVEKGAVKVAQREAEFGIKLGHAKNGAVQLWKNDLAKTREHINLAKTKVADAKNGAVQLWKNDLAKTREHIDLAKTKVADAKNGAVQFLKDDVAKTGDHINLAKTKVGETVDNLSTKAVEMKDATVNSVVSTAQGVKQGAVENVDAFVANRAMAKLNKGSAAEFGGLFRKLNGEQKALFQQQASGISDYNQLTAIAKGLLGA